MSRDLLRLAPELRRRIWGGDRLPSTLGVTPPPGADPVGEAWLAYGGSRIVGGRNDGRRFGDVVASAPLDVVGEASLARYGPIVPLLVKFLDAAQDLSLQVHPNDEQALERHPDLGHLGKTESWRILDAEPGAIIRWGFERSLSEQELRAALEEGTVMSLVRSLPVAAGDVVHNPAGTVHGVGAGLMIYELQQASDITYRLWDYRRVGADGSERELHIDDGVAVADRSGAGEPFARPMREPTPSDWTTRVACPYYLLDEVAASASSATGYHVDGDTAGTLHLLTVIEGTATVIDSHGTETSARRGETLALPAAFGSYEVAGRGLSLRGRVAAPDEVNG